MQFKVRFIIQSYIMFDKDEDGARECEKIIAIFDEHKKKKDGIIDFEIDAENERDVIVTTANAAVIGLIAIDIERHYDNYHGGIGGVVWIEDEAAGGTPEF